MRTANYIFGKEPGSGGVTNRKTILLHQHTAPFFEIEGKAGGAKKGREKGCKRKKRLKQTRKENKRIS